MNLVLSFVQASKPPRSAGPFKAIRFDAESIVDVANNQQIAIHREHQWEVEGDRYFRLDATSPVRIHFEQRATGAKSRQFGPYRNFSAVDGIAYTEDRVFAFLDTELADWFCYDDGRHWPLMFVYDDTLSNAGRFGILALLAPLLAGVYTLWSPTHLLYVGRADGGGETIGSALTSFARGKGAIQPNRVSAVTWEVSANPAAAEAQVLAQYNPATGTPDLRAAFSRFHESCSQTREAISIAAATRKRSAAARSRARDLRRRIALDREQARAA